MTNIHYVYAYIDPATNVPFYIGKGQHDRYIRHLTDSKNPRRNLSYPYFYRKINKIRREIGRDPIVIKIAENLTVDTAYFYEELAITALGRKLYEEHGMLCNIDPGGKGSRGAKRSPETCKAIGDGKRGKKATPEAIESNRRSHYAEMLKPETRAKLSAASKGANNKAALRCTLRKPDGSIIVVDSFLDFCKEANLNYKALNDSLRFNQPVAPSRKKGYADRNNTVGWQLLEKKPIRLV